ncbi:hypothetical protein ON010_g4465 [Phytophthora cinnamomi]|nr:hypothetical protein ON010_g4465 [Phytophthora cinnamomi]
MAAKARSGCMHEQHGEVHHNDSGFDSRDGWPCAVDPFGFAALPGPRAKRTSLKASCYRSRGRIELGRVLPGGTTSRCWWSVIPGWHLLPSLADARFVVNETRNLGGEARFSRKQPSATYPRARWTIDGLRQNFAAHRALAAAQRLSRLAQGARFELPSSGAVLLCRDRLTHRDAGRQLGSAHQAEVDHVAVGVTNAQASRLGSAEAGRAEEAFARSIAAAESSACISARIRGVRPNVNDERTPRGTFGAQKRAETAPKSSSTSKELAPRVQLQSNVLERFVASYAAHPRVVTPVFWG